MFILNIYLVVWVSQTGHFMPLERAMALKAPWIRQWYWQPN